MNSNNKKIIYSAIIALGCFLPWVKMGLFSISGTNWEPAIILLIVALAGGGIAFYNNNQSKNILPWSSTVVGILGLLVCGYAAYYAYEIQKSMNVLSDSLNSFDWENMQPKTPEKGSAWSVLSFIGIGYYLTLAGSFLMLFATKDSTQNTTIDYSEFINYKEPEQKESPAKKWLEENPGKSINDYYLQNKKS